MAAVRSIINCSKVETTATVTVLRTPPSVRFTVQASPTTTGPHKRSSRAAVTAGSTMLPVGALLARVKPRPAFTPSVEIVITAPAAAALKPGVALIAAVRPVARSVRLAAPMKLTLVSTPATVRVTFQRSSAVTGPCTTKSRETESAAGAASTSVTKIAPLRLTTSRSLPSALARKLSAAAALIAAARPAATPAKVLPLAVTLKLAITLGLASPLGQVRKPSVHTSPGATLPVRVVRAVETAAVLATMLLAGVTASTGAAIAAPFFASTTVLPSATAE